MQGEKLTEIMQGLQENESKQLEMVASFMGSLVEAIKDKKYVTLEFNNLLEKELTSIRRKDGRSLLYFCYCSQSQVSFHHIYRTIKLFLRKGPIIINVV